MSELLQEEAGWRQLMALSGPPRDRRCVCSWHEATWPARPGMSGLGGRTEVGISRAAGPL